MGASTDPSQLVRHLNLKECETFALAFLVDSGRTITSCCLRDSEFFNTQVCGVLDLLASHDFVKIIPGRPK
jgi:sugar-specific transcriptional regulator TrmB